MKIKLEELFSSDEMIKTYSKTIQLSSDGFEEFLIKDFKPCDLKITVYSVDEKKFIDFNYNMDAKYQCSRCLQDVEKQISGSFSREIVLDGDKFYEEEGVLIVHDDEIDVEEVLLEALYLTTNSNVVCDENCKGLCPKCGANLNVESCSCDLNDIDPRFAKLIGLKEKLSK